MAKRIYFPKNDKTNELFEKCCDIQSSITQAETDSIYAMSDFIAATSTYISNDLKTLHIRKDNVAKLRSLYLRISHDLDDVCRLLGYESRPLCKTVFRSEQGEDAK